MITISVFLLIAYLEQYLLINPFAFHIPVGKLTSLILIIILSIMSGLALPIEIIKIIKKDFHFQNSKDFFAILIGVSASCGCTAGVGLSLITVFGVAASSLLGFLEYYQNPIRAISIFILFYSFYFEVKTYGQNYCKIK